MKKRKRVRQMGKERERRNRKRGGYEHGVRVREREWKEWRKQR